MRPKYREFGRRMVGRKAQASIHAVVASLRRAAAKLPVGGRFVFRVVHHLLELLRKSLPVPGDFLLTDDAKPSAHRDEFVITAAIDQDQAHFLAAKETTDEIFGMNVASQDAEPQAPLLKAGQFETTGLIGNAIVLQGFEQGRGNRSVVVQNEIPNGSKAEIRFDPLLEPRHVLKVAPTARQPLAFAHFASRFVAVDGFGPQNLDAPPRIFGMAINAPNGTGRKKRIVRQREHGRQIPADWRAAALVSSRPHNIPNSFYRNPPEPISKGSCKNRRLRRNIYRDFSQHPDHWSGL
ncbi:MAG: hypothetical protein WD872_01040 [Pirellulaceae bacterium]